MGDRGPKPKGEYQNLRAVFSTRITPELRRQLESAAHASGRSLSQEIEHRLRMSFVTDPVPATGDVNQTLATCLELIDATKSEIARAIEESKPENKTSSRVRRVLMLSAL